ncbi:MAG: hypothetical protein HY216_12595 [Candidatus Rokubacteria bacterium]|nr:hypothetical protein [Candidatus Rokubacteria bacterium]
MSDDDVLALLEDALAFGDTLVVVRSGAAIAEVTGGPLRRGQEWLTLGDEGAGRSHVHVRMADVQALRFRQTEGRNAALDVLDGGASVILSLSFRGTNAARAERFDAERLAKIRARFGHLEGTAL